ncbi:MAG: hypothetical protein ABR613_12645 [Actinomycetota bacterium]
MKKLIASLAVAAALALPATSAQAGDVARAGVSKCSGGGSRGFVVWWYDLDNQYQELNFCIYTGP